MQQRVHSHSHSRREMKKYTMEEVGKHTTRETGIWVAVHGSVYCVTNYLAHHPGGELTILGMAGRDCTDSWSVFHSKEVLEKVLPKYKIGEVKDYKLTAMQQDFYAMIDRLELEGKFDASVWWYTKKWSINFSLFAIALISLAYSTSFLGYMWTAFVLGCFLHQMAFMGHDYGHNSITKSKEGDWPMGVVVAAFMGVSGEWWKRSHNVHHILTNSVTHDPDIQHLPAMAVTPKIFPGFYSTYHQKQFKFDRLSQLLVGIQHYMYYPILLVVARYNLTLQSFLLCLDMRRDRNNRLIDLCALIVFVSWMVLVLSYLPDWPTLICFNLISHAVAGLVHVQITLSHFGMDTYNGPGYDEPDHFVRTQFATTMDVDCPQWLDWLHGGLQFQLVHHLMPRLPRHSLRYARDMYVKEFAAKHGLKYTIYPFAEANRVVISMMREAAMEARAWPNGPTDKLKVLLNAEG